MLTTTDIVQVLSYYDLGTLQGMTSAGRGFVNETAFVQTSEGRFVVRRNHRRLTEASHRYRHKLIAWLHTNRFPTPAILPSCTGETLLELDGRSYEVMEFVKGDDFNSGHLQELHSVGAMLARYHVLVQHFPPPPETALLRYCPQNMLGLTELLLERDVMGELIDLLGQYDLRAAGLRKILSDDTYRALPHLVIHGDIHRDNLLFAQDQVVALLDYDQVAWDTPLADLADALVAFASVDKPKTITWGVFPGPLHEGRVEQLLTGYASIARLSPTEIDMLPILLEVSWLRAELGRVISTPEGAPDYHRSVLEQGIELSQWINKRRERLIEQWQMIFVNADSPIIAVAA